MKNLRLDGNVFVPDSTLPGLAAGIVGRRAGLLYGDELAPVRLQERNLLSSLTGLPGEHIVFLNQVHGDDCFVMRDMPSEAALYAGDADAIVTDVPGLCVVIRTADCVPVILYDPVLKVLAAVHSGWKGTLLGIAGRAAHIMRSDFSCDPGGIHALILPSIGPATYQVGPDVASHFPGYVTERDGSLYLDLWGRIGDTLLDEGIQREHITGTETCNLTRSDEFYSHRGGDRGRNLNFAYITG